MRVPSFERFQRLSAAAAFFVCGMVVGAAVWSGLAGEQLNSARLENIALNERIVQYKEQIAQMKSDLRKESVIASIVVFVVEPPDKPKLDAVTEKELKRRLKEDLAGFRGRRIYDIGEDAEFARSVLEKKSYTGIGEKDFLVRITTILVADGVLQVWVEARVHVQP